MTIHSIIKKAIKRLELEGKLLTPDSYAEAFCKEATKAGMLTEDCGHVEKASRTMSKELQKEVISYRVKTMKELTRFLISKINRSNPSKSIEILDSQTLLMKRILQVIEVLHNKEASDLAKKSQELLQSMPSVSQLDQFRQSWVNFLTTYDDTFLKKLSVFGGIDTRNLKQSIENLHLGTSSNTDGEIDLKKVSSLLIYSLAPSIASSQNETIKSIREKIKQTPSLLDDATIAKEVQSVISLRILLDNESVKGMVESIDVILDEISLRLIEMIEISDNSTLGTQKIKSELESCTEEDTTNFKIAHKKLYTITLAMEKNTQLFSKGLRSHSGEIERLSQANAKLERELNVAREESKVDFLTKLYNRRALDEYIALKEASYKRYGHNFSIIMFDLDKFKDVNDTFGHDAGDAVLSAFAKIIKKEARAVDIIGRFGGEEFMAVLNETDAKGAVVFAEKVRVHVEKAKFMYKKKRIYVTVSSGVSERSKHVSVDAVVNSADEYLYKAKNSGRNKVASLFG